MKRKESLFSLGGFFMFISFLGITFFQISCNKDDESLISSGEMSNSFYNCATCKTAAIAKAQFDNAYNGIYYGITSDGVVSIDLNNSSPNKTVAEYSLSSKKIELFLESENIVSGKYRAIFTNSTELEKYFKLIFEVNIDGTEPTMQLNYDRVVGRVIVANNIVKELSNSMIEVFEGSKNKKVYGVQFIEGNYIERLPLQNEEPISKDFFLERVSKEKIILSRVSNSWYLISAENSGLIKVKKGIIRNGILYDEQNIQLGKLKGDAIENSYQNDDGVFVYQALRTI